MANPYHLGRLLFFCISFLSIPFLHGQFFLNGSAVTLNDSCYQLTSATNWEVGSIWNGDLISLEEDFEVFVDLYFGCQDETGADGIVFALQPISTSIGVGGGSIGIGNVLPSLSVEFDTHENADLGDPTFDHIAVIRDGSLNHNLAAGALAGPVQASASNLNIEDCTYHTIRVTWDAQTNTLETYFDCELRLTYSGEVINTIFGGDPMVYWGFTSATGGLNNVHEVCFSYTSFINELVDQEICPGGEVELMAGGGVSYLWSPTEGLSNTEIQNPIASPTETTLYTVEILDDCGIPFYDDVLVVVENQINVNIEIDPADLTEVYQGLDFNLNANVIPADPGTYTYAWSSDFGSTFTIPTAQNTTVEASVDHLGTETFTISVGTPDGCSATADISLEILEPQFEIPNVFSPNGDNINERFGLFTAIAVDDYFCKVFNRWGQLIFETTNYSQFWDGTYNDTEAPSDVYLYLVNFRVGGTSYEENGDLTLVR